MKDDYHWYTRDGKASHDSTLKEAREQNLLPSVTTVLSVIDKYFLNNWQEEQLVDIALVFRPDEPENKRSYYKRIREIKKYHQQKALDTGSEMHQAIEDYIKSRGKKIKEGDFFTPVYKWINENLVLDGASCEERLVNLQSGYAGTCDFHGMGKDGAYWIVDFKTQKTDKGNEVVKKRKYIKKYNEWRYQLAAYAGVLIERELPAKEISVVSVAISSTEPGYIKMFDYTDDQMAIAVAAFDAALTLWRIENNFPYKKELKENDE